jgi:hypothetical protein
MEICLVRRRQGRCNKRAHLCLLYGYLVTEELSHFALWVRPDRFIDNFLHLNSLM